MRIGFEKKNASGTHARQATAPIHGIWRSFPTAHPTYPNTPTSMLSVKTRRKSGSYTPPLRRAIHTIHQSLSRPVVTSARTTPTTLPMFVRPCQGIDMGIRVS